MASSYKPEYFNSWAIAVGINEYASTSPLAYARNDAEGFAAILRERFAFPKENIILITDKDATRERILAEFLSFANGRSQPDDRLIFFFAGHGHTQTGARGEIGFLVPVDGTPDNLASLIRWDELTRNAELIPAKHVLFVMDACYGGLAVTRYTPPGTMRFIKDMLQRYSRQVLTAGKANETVSDSGGPKPGHSIFTGHLLTALEGAAAASEGILTANGVMAYVYDRVARDYQSRQTPHYGFLDGDGDMIFDLKLIESLTASTKVDKDILVQIPASFASQPELDQLQTVEDQVKELLSDTKYRIRLHDFVKREARAFTAVTGDDRFPVANVSSNEVSPGRIAARLNEYESRVRTLQSTIALLSRWGGAEQRQLIEQVLALLSDSHGERSGFVVWLGLRWYPIVLLMYSGGIAALAANDYASFASVLTASVTISRTVSEIQPIVVPAIDAMLELERGNAFKQLAGHENNYAPRSEYLFKVAQPPLEDLFSLGSSYERLFDEFEVFLALVFADQRREKGGRVWGPPGRFAWKYCANHDRNPFMNVVRKAEEMKAAWDPLRTGFFGGTYERFEAVVAEYKKLLDGLTWY